MLKEGVTLLYVSSMTSPLAQALEKLSTGFVEKLCNNSLLPLGDGGSIRLDNKNTVKTYAACLAIGSITYIIHDVNYIGKSYIYS